MTLARAIVVLLLAGFAGEIVATVAYWWNLVALIPITIAWALLSPYIKEDC